MFKEARNRFLGIDSASICTLAGQYDKKGHRTGPPGWESIPGLLKRFTKRAQATLASGIGSLESIPRLHNMKNEDEDNFFLIEAKKNEYIHTSTNKGTKKNELFVPQLSQERRRSEVFVPQLAKYLFLNYRRNEYEAKYSFLNYRRNEDEAKYSFLNYR
jgi:hypothetical protein